MLTIKELKAVIQDMDDDANIYVGCQGYTNYGECQDNETKAFVHDGNLFVTDSCKLEGKE